MPLVLKITGAADLKRMCLPVALAIQCTVSASEARS